MKQTTLPHVPKRPEPLTAEETARRSRELVERIRSGDLRPYEARR